MAQVGGRVDHVGRADGFARVLDVDEHRLAVRRFGRARDFTVRRAHQKAFQRVGGGRLAGTGGDGQRAAIGLGVVQRLGAAVAHLARNAHQHHAVGHVGE